jgi:predicted ArsR family transcriptional regulator
MARLDAIADPLRLRIVRHLDGAPGATLQELADAAGVHLNTIRPHAAALEDAGVVVRAAAPPAGRGRPRVEYRLAGDWSPPTSDFRGLAELLAAALMRGGHGPEELRAVGLEWGRYLHGRPGGHDVARDVPDALEQLGFEARVDDSTLRLTGCPCSRVLPDRPELICELAVAVADGVLAGSGSDVRVGAREHDPEAHRCQLHLEHAARPGARRRRLRGPRRRRAEAGR